MITTILMRLYLYIAILLLLPVGLHAQIGEHRSTLSVGANAGYVLSDVGFEPTVSQTYHSGLTGGFTIRYTSEKYFKTICALQAEVNYASIGWKQEIKNRKDGAVINSNGNAERYSRTINYVQIPLLAHLAWGKEEQGFNFFINLGPQFGIYLSDSASKNYDEPNLNDDDTGRSNTVVAQETMPIEKKLDYGIALGGGLEYAHRRLGRFELEGRYYYGLGNIYGSSKRDYFGKSNFGNIIIKATYLFDIVKTKN